MRGLARQVRRAVKRPHDPHTATVQVRGRRVDFAIDQPDDVVQRVLLRGNLYEQHLLHRHHDHIYKGSTVLDVGANVGNHSVFYALSPATRVYSFEPHPRAMACLRRTAERNRLDSLDLRHLGVAVGAEPGEARLHTSARTNLGGSRLDKRGETPVDVRPLDDFDIVGNVSFIKIDVEGHEVAVLRGATDLIAAHRPAIGIEVDDVNLGDFWDWADSANYRVIHAVKNHHRNINYVCIPAGPVPATR